MQEPGGQEVGGLTPDGAVGTEGLSLLESPGTAVDMSVYLGRVLFAFQRRHDLS